jgi:hypothetical protein
VAKKSVTNRTLPGPSGSVDNDPLSAVGANHVQLRPKRLLHFVVAVFTLVVPLEDGGPPPVPERNTKHIGALANQFGDVDRREPVPSLVV